MKAVDNKRTIWLLFNTRDFHPGSLQNLWWVVPVTFERGNWPIKKSNSKKNTKKKLAWRRVPSPWKWKPSWDTSTKLNVEEELDLGLNQIKSSSLDYSPVLGTIKNSAGESLMMLSLLHPEVETVYDFSGDANHFDGIKLFERFNDITSRYKKVRVS